jgi:hypothetical protein
MKFVSQSMATAKSELAQLVERLPLDDLSRKDLSKKIAKFTATAVREDRVHRHTTDALAKLADVFFNGRSA